MKEWRAYLEDLRSRELHAAFRDCPPKLFPRALELGAGSGFQSRKLIAYAEHLVSTDFNPERLKRVPIEGVEYRTLDAEKTGEAFSPRSFDLVFSSNLFEHLPEPAAALGGIRTVLAKGGVVILIMPNALWKAFSLLGFYPYMFALMLRALRGGRMKALWTKYVLRKTPAREEKGPGNNLKSEKHDAAGAGIFWPTPHGAYRSHFEEFVQYRRKRWLGAFTRAGFETITVRKGPVFSGYGFGLDGLRRFLETLGLTSEYIYVLKDAGTPSRYEAYWKA